MGLAAQQLRLIEAGFARQAPVEQKHGTKRSVVVCILRVPPSPAAPAAPAASRDGSLEMFFILRSAREGDRWGGQVREPFCILRYHSAALGPVAL